jgi:hypothetical protein
MTSEIMIGTLLLAEVQTFCSNSKIGILKMEDKSVAK